MAKMMHEKRSSYQHPLMGGVETLRGWLMATFPIHLAPLGGSSRYTAFVWVFVL